MPHFLQMLSITVNREEVTGDSSGCCAAMMSHIFCRIQAKTRYTIADCTILCRPEAMKLFAGPSVYSVPQDAAFVQKILH